MSSVPRLLPLHVGERAYLNEMRSLTTGPRSSRSFIGKGSGSRRSTGEGPRINLIGRQIFRPIYR